MLREGAKGCQVASETGNWKMEIRKWKPERKVLNRWARSPSSLKMPGSENTPHPITPFPSSLSPGEREEGEGSWGEGSVHFHGFWVPVSRRA